MSFPLVVIEDANIDYLLKRQFITPIAFAKAATISNSSVGGPATLSAGWNSTAAQLLNVAATEHAALQFSSTAATATAIFRPSDMDNRWPLYVRYAWTSNAAVASVATFTSRFGVIGAGFAPATPSSTYSKDIVADAKATAATAWTWTRWANVGPLNTGNFAFQTFPATVDAVAFSISVSSLTLAAVATDFVWLYGVEVAYTPRQTFGDGSGREARYMPQVLAVGPQEAGPTFHIKS